MNHLLLFRPLKAVKSAFFRPDNSPADEKRAKPVVDYNWIMKLKIGLVLGFVLLLILALTGWQLTPRIEVFSPAEGDLHGRMPIVISFSRVMNSASVESALTILPGQPGEYSWNEDLNQLTFSPSKAWPAGETITILFEGGVRSRIKLPLIGNFSREIPVSPILLVYLWPADRTSNLYLANPISGENQALTQEPNGVLDYAISQDGEKIYYSAAAENGASRIMILDTQSKESGEIISCSEGLCTVPRISPDGNLLAYEYIPKESGKLPTVRVLDIEVMTYLDLGKDNQYLEKPIWSSSGWLAYYNLTQKAYQFWNPETGEIVILPNETGGAGSWSPDGRYFISSEILFLSDTLAPRHLQLFDLKEKTMLDLSRGSYPEDLNPSFAPSGLTIAYSHKSLDPALWTPGRELWILNINSGENTQLTDIVDYQHTSFAWHPDGRQLAYVRYNQAALSDPPEIWLTNTTGGEPLRLIINGFQPGWIP